MTTAVDRKGPLVMSDVRATIEGIYDDVLRRNPGEQEFHQAVREVVESLAPVLARHPEYVQLNTIERICEPSGRSSSACRGRTTPASRTSTVASVSSSTRPSAPTRVACAFTPRSTSAS